MKKSPTLNELFCGMPYLLKYFKEMDRTIKTFSPQTGKCEEIEAIKKKRRDLLKTAKELDRTDLQIIYYLRRSHKIQPRTLLLSLKRLIQAQEEVESLSSPSVSNEVPPPVISTVTNEVRATEPPLGHFE